MAWIQQTRADGATSLSISDAAALAQATYSATANVSCVVFVQNEILALKGVTGPCRQATSVTDASGGITTKSLAFGSANAAGNTLVVVAACNPDGFGPILATCSDSNGNTYTKVADDLFSGGADMQLVVFVATGCNAGANTVTVNITNEFTPSPPFSGTSGYLNLSVLEYPGGTGADGYAITTSATGGSLTVSLATSRLSDTLLNITAMSPACPGSPTSITGPSGGPVIPGAWLVVNEPPSGSPATGGGFTDRSTYLFLGKGAQHSFNLQNRQRGNAIYTLVSDPFDATSAPADYRPTLFQPIYLFDQNLSGYTLMFSGLIQDYTIRWVGIDGLHYIDCTAVSLEAVFDTVYCDGTDSFTNETCGAILTALFNKYETGCPVSLGTVQDGETIPLFNPQKGQKISEIAQQLALTSSFIWGVDPQLQQLYFCAPTARTAPFNLTSSQALWDSISEKIDGADYRNRQGVKIADEAFPQSGEWFAGAGQQQITLLRPVKQVVSAYITLGTPNFATGTFSGQPSPGDTITIGPQDIPFGIGTYLIDQIIVQDGFVQQITTPGTFASTPTFSQVTGGTSTGGGTGIFTCLGPYGVGAGVEASTTYTFVTSLDNTQYGEVLIGATLAATVQNLVDAINSTAPYGGPPPTAGRGVTFSLPTWEGAQVNAYLLSGTQLKVITKQDAVVAASALSKVSANFSWSSAQTSGGNFPQGSLGPNQPGTISIQVYQVGTNTAAPAVAYVPGSAVITMATPLDAGSNLNVWYTRADGGSIEVEDTALVTALAATTHGTGKIQQFTDQSSQGIISTSARAGLQLAQQALAGFDTAPTELDVILYRPGILPGQIWTWALTFNSALNSDWFVTEIKAEIIPGVTHGTGIDGPQVPGGGHYRYTIHVVNVSQIASYMDFWLGQGGGGGVGGGGIGSGALVPTSGAGLPTTGNYGPTIEVNGAPGSGAATGIANLESGFGLSVTDLGNGNYQFAATGATAATASKYTASWTSQTSVSVAHNLATTAVLVQVYDGSGNKVTPQGIQIVDANTVALTFGAAFTGSVTVVGIGANPTTAEYTTSWTAQTSVVVTHNLGSSNVFVQVRDASGNLVIPQNIAITSSTVVTLTFGAAFTGSVLVVALPSPVRQYNASWSAQTSVTVSHNLGTTAVIVQVYDASGNQEIPQNIAITDANTVTLTFGASFTGSVSVMG
jgi:hypothetical protein